jgi:hypothetical protein
LRRHPPRSSAIGHDNAPYQGLSRAGSYLYIRTAQCVNVSRMKQIAFISMMRKVSSQLQWPRLLSLLYGLEGGFSMEPDAEYERLLGSIDELPLCISPWLLCRSQAPQTFTLDRPTSSQEFPLAPSQTAQSVHRSCKASSALLPTPEVAPPLDGRRILARIHLVRLDPRRYLAFWGTSSSPSTSSLYLPNSYQLVETLHGLAIFAFAGSGKDCLATYRQIQASMRTRFSVNCIGNRFDPASRTGAYAVPIGRKLRNHQCEAKINWLWDRQQWHVRHAN